MAEIVHFRASKGKPGRPRKHADDAARYAARDEKMRIAVAEAEMLREVINTPSPEFLHRTGRRAMKWALANDKDLAEVAVRLAAAFLAGLEAEGGQNVGDAVRNSVRHETRRCQEPDQSLPAQTDTWNLV